MKGTVNIKQKPIPLALVQKILNNAAPADDDEFLKVARELPLTVEQVSEAFTIAGPLYNSCDSAAPMMIGIAKSKLSNLQQVLATWYLSRIEYNVEIEQSATDFENELEQFTSNLPDYLLYDFTDLDEMEQAVGEAQTILGEKSLEKRWPMVEDVLTRGQYSHVVQSYFAALLVLGKDEDNKRFFDLLSESVTTARLAETTSQG